MDLYLDHFYASFSPEVFKELTSITSMIGGINHKVIERSDATYEGVYIHSKTGPYVELLIDETIKFVSIAMHTTDSPLSDHQLYNLPDERFTWNKGEVIQSPKSDKSDDQPPIDWFRSRSITQKDVFNDDTETEFLSLGYAGSYIIDYQNEIFNKSLQYKKTGKHRFSDNCDVIYPISFSFWLPEKYREYDPYWFSWIGKLVEANEERVVLELQSLNSPPVQVAYVFTNGRIGFRHFTLKLEDTTTIDSSVEFENFTLKIDDDLSELTFQFDERF